MSDYNTFRLPTEITKDHRMEKSPSSKLYCNVYITKMNCKIYFIYKKRHK